jgi:hypothetical protein
MTTLWILYYSEMSQHGADTTLNAPWSSQNLISALNKLVEAFSQASHTSTNDMMVINPEILNGTCSFALFDDDDLKRLAQFSGSLAEFTPSDNQAREWL